MVTVQYAEVNVTRPPRYFMHSSHPLPARALLQNFQINAAGHILVLKHFAPLLAAAAKGNGATA